MALPAELDGFIAGGGAISRPAGSGAKLEFFTLKVSGFAAEVTSSTIPGAAVASSSTCLISEWSSSAVIWPLSSAPPESSMLFHFTPQSLQSMWSDPSNSARRLPKGSVSMGSNRTATRVSNVVSA